MSDREQRFLGWSAAIIAIVTLVVGAMLAALQMVQVPSKPARDLFERFSSWLYYDRSQISVWLIIFCGILLLLLAVVGVAWVILRFPVRRYRTRKAAEDDRARQAAATALARFHQHERDREEARAQRDALAVVRANLERMVAIWLKLRESETLSDDEYSDLVIYAEHSRNDMSQSLKRWHSASETFETVPWCERSAEPVRGLNYTVDLTLPIRYVGGFLRDHNSSFSIAGMTTQAFFDTYVGLLERQQEVSTAQGYLASPSAREVALEYIARWRWRTASFMPDEERQSEFQRVSEQEAPDDITESAKYLAQTIGELSSQITLDMRLQRLAELVETGRDLGFQIPTQSNQHKWLEAFTWYANVKTVLPPDWLPKWEERPNMRGSSGSLMPDFDVLVPRLEAIIAILKKQVRT